MFTRYPIGLSLVVSGATKFRPLKWLRTVLSLVGATLYVAFSNVCMFMMVTLL